MKNPRSNIIAAFPNLAANPIDNNSSSSLVDLNKFKRKKELININTIMQIPTLKLAPEPNKVSITPMTKLVELSSRTVFLPNLSRIVCLPTALSPFLSLKSFNDIRAMNKK